MEDNNQTKNSINKENQANNNGGSMSCHNSPKRLTHIVKHLRNTRKMKMKT